MPRSSRSSACWPLSAVSTEYPSRKSSVYSPSCASRLSSTTRMRSVFGMPYRQYGGDPAEGSTPRPEGGSGAAEGLISTPPFAWTAEHRQLAVVLVRCRQDVEQA